jgi:cytochrome c oxidase subunit 3
LLAAAITMIFAAETSALLVSEGGASDWQHVALPSMFYWNTVMLLVSGILVETARRQLRHLAKGATQWLIAGLLTAASFLIAQIAVLQRFHSQGFSIASSLSHSYFLVMLGGYAACAVGGIAALAVGGLRLRNLPPSGLASLDAACYYWYYVVGLWCYLLAVFWMRM